MTKRGSKTLPPPKPVDVAKELRERSGSLLKTANRLREEAFELAAIAEKLDPQ